MSDNTYLFIDGQYLRQRHKEAMQTFFGVDGDLELSPMMQQARATRAYFYDAIDYVRLPDETDKAWEARVGSLEEFFAYVRSLDGFHVRPGSVKRGKKRDQKEVDVLLAVDMVTLGFNGSMSKAVLVAGDVDFRPAVEELVRHGVVVHVWYHGSSFAQELPAAADFGREIRFRDLYSWNTESFQDSHRIPHDAENIGHHQGPPVKIGSAAGCAVDIHQTETLAGPMFHLWVDLGKGRSRTISDPDLSLIERYVAAQYGVSIEWEASGDEIHVTGQAP